MPPTATNLFRILTLGGLGVERGGTAVSALSSQRKALALLAVLAAHGPKGVSRDRIVALLWSDADADSARNALAQLLHRVRRELGPESITGNGELRLNASVVSSDVGEFRAAQAEGDAAGAAALYGGDFLHAVQLRLGGEFDRWVEGERSALRVNCARALEQLATAALSRGDSGANVHWRRRLVDLDPLSVAPTLRYMEALVADGNREGAIRHAMVYASLVRSELDAEPDALVGRCADELRAGSAPAAATPVTVPGAKAESVETAAQPTLPPHEDRVAVRAASRGVSRRVFAVTLFAASALIIAVFEVTRGDSMRPLTTPAGASSLSLVPLGDAHLTRLANSSLIKANGAVSQDGRYFYSGTGTRSRELTRIDLASGHIDTIAHFEGDVDNVSLSPDGKLLAAAVWLDIAPSERDRYDGTSLWVVGADGSGKRMLARPYHMGDYQPSGWTADSKQIVVLAQRDSTSGEFHDYDAYFDLVAVADGSVRRVARIGPGWPRRTSASPDGKFVAFTHFDVQSGRKHLRLLASASGRMVDLLPQQSNEEFFDWAPDGKGFFFLREGGEGRTLLFQRFDGTRATGEAQLVKSDLPRVSPVGVSRDGNMYYVVLDDLPQVSIGVIDSTPGRARSLTPVDTRPTHGTLGGLFSPDGRRFAYLAQHAPQTVPGEASLVIQTLDGADSREVPVRLRRTAMPNWSSDSREITLVGVGSNGWESVIVNAETGAVVHARASHQPPWLTLGRPVILGDRSFFVGLGDTADPRGVLSASNLAVRIDGATGRETVLGRVPRMVRMAPAPDGKSFIAFVQERGRQLLHLYSIERDTISFVRNLGPVEVSRTGRDATTATWCSDGRSLVVAIDMQRGDGPQLTRFVRYKVDGSAPTHLFGVPGRFMLQSLHPDCKRFAVLRQAQATAELFMIEGLRALKF